MRNFPQENFAPNESAMSNLRKILPNGTFFTKRTGEWCQPDSALSAYVLSGKFQKELVGKAQIKIDKSLLLPSWHSICLMRSARIIGSKERQKLFAER